MFKYPAHCGQTGSRTPARGSHQHRHSKGRIVGLTSSFPSFPETCLPGGKAPKKNRSLKSDGLTESQGWWVPEAGGKGLAFRDGTRQVDRL